MPDIAYPLDPGLSNLPTAYSPVPNNDNDFPVTILKLLKEKFPTAIKHVGIIWSNATPSTAEAEKTFVTEFPILYFPIPVPAGSVIIVEVYSAFGGPFGLVGASLYGFGDLVTPTPLRNDGRSRPQHTNLGESYQNGLGTGVIVAAPTSPGRVLIGGGNLSAFGEQAGTSFSALSCTVNGNVVHPMNILLPNTAGALATMERDWPEGILCDPDTAVNLINTGAACEAVCDIDFDYVI
jgi:hypothetical protein